MYHPEKWGEGYYISVIGSYAYKFEDGVFKEVPCITPPKHHICLEFEEDEVEIITDFIK